MSQINSKCTTLFFRKVKGFTIMETLIALALTGLISLLVFAGIRYYHRLFSMIKLAGQTQTEINLLQQALQNDFSKAKEVFYEDGIICNNVAGVVAYRFVEDGIVRLYDFKPDTFHLKYQQPEIIMAAGLDHLIGEVNIVCYNEDLQFPVSAIKEYPIGLITE